MHKLMIELLPGGQTIFAAAAVDPQIPPPEGNRATTAAQYFTPTPTGYSNIDGNIAGTWLGNTAIRGTLIPRATITGASSGCNPHDLSDAVLVVDPNFPTRHELRFGDAAPVAEKAAAVTRPLVPPTPGMPPGALFDAFMKQHNGHTGGAPISDKPCYRVNFEIQGWGSHRALYHDVVLAGGALVLVYRADTAEAEAYWPPAGEEAPPLALHVEGTSVVYLVHPTGIRFVHQAYEYCLLLVEREAGMA